MANVLLKNRVAAFNVDAYNRTAVCASAIDNGCVFALNAYSTTSGEGMVWTATAPTAATDTGLWMAASPEVVVTTVAGGDGNLQFKGIAVDPRTFTNNAGAMIDAIKLVPGDIIEMTGAGITDVGTVSNTHLVPAGDSFTLVVATEAGTGFCLKKIGTGILHVGRGGLAPAPVVTYKFECVGN